MSGAADPGAPTPDDLALVDAARAAITARYRADWHVVGAALRTRSGRVFTGVHLEATVGRIAVCAEAVALGRAATEAGDTEVETIVAVRHPDPDARDRRVQVVAPCGTCRELIADYAPAARVLVPGGDGEPVVRRVAALLPGKYARPRAGAPERARLTAGAQVAAAAPVERRGRPEARAQHVGRGA